MPETKPSDAPTSEAPRRILVTGGAGFIGSSLALGLAAKHPTWEIVALDNLRRRGSELNLPRLRAAGVAFAHGDVRSLEDLLLACPNGDNGANGLNGALDAIVECSAEPSVMAGVDSSPDYVLQTNLFGAYNCLELARRTGAQFLFLSTSRVYPVAGLAGLSYREADTRFELAAEQPCPGASSRGIAESFPLGGARTLYGATKLAAELLIAEYADSYGLNTVVDRCGVIAGPWQFGKVDQGVFTYWLLAHHFKRPLSYIGFGGSGKQVRDLLHVDDLLDLVDIQLSEPGRWAGEVVNVGGGLDCSLSLLETTELCQRIAGQEIAIPAAGEDRPGDVPIYLSDCARLFERTPWRPQRGAAEILTDIHAWIVEHEAALAGALG
ncbi:MAG TPA: NAD-dependent epimerase/dehydratase family protein [Solirubrobacteraceae bacterium]|nr:NAD-dependent epimerase/dehydratase family protein [Solirubrobacteraceae bacterium]